MGRIFNGVAPSNANHAAEMLSKYVGEPGMGSDARAEMDWIEFPTKSARNRAEGYVRDALNALCPKNKPTP